VVNTFQLIGKFLSLKGADVKGKTVDVVEHCDRFWYWLTEVGITHQRSGIVRAIAEKCITWMPGIYDSSHFEVPEEALSLAADSAAAATLQDAPEQLVA
jgi:hypothetical protein